MRVEIIGHVCIDRNTFEGVPYEGAGSPAMFMWKIFRQLPDCNSQIIAPYGQDFLEFSNGVSLIPSQPLDIKTMVYNNIVQNGQRRQNCFNYPGAIPVQIDNAVIEAMHTADVVCFAPLAPNYSADYVQTAIKYMKKDAQTVLLPQGYFREFNSKNNVIVRDFKEADFILPLFHVVIVSKDDHPDMIQSAQKWSSRHGCIFIVTQAEKGATVVNGNTKTEVPTMPVPDSEIVSSVGAGEIFAAGVIYKIAQSKDVIEAHNSATVLPANVFSVNLTKLL